MLNLTTAGGVTYQIDNPGLVGILYKGTKVATGPLLFSEGSAEYYPKAPDVSLPVVGNPVASGLYSASGVYSYYASGLEVLQSFTVVGEDLHISVTVSNGSQQTLRCPVMRGLQFLFGDGIKTNATQWHPSELTAAPSMCIHPSYAVPIGCSYRLDKNYGMSVWSHSEFFKKKLLQFQFTTDNFATDGTMKNSILECYFPFEVENGESKVFDFVLRVGNPDPYFLLATYKAYLNQTPRRYVPCDLPVIISASVGSSFISPANPYGYQDDGTGFRRFDTAAGCKLFVQRVKRPWNQVIVWALGGWNSRGVMYNPAFDAFPPEVMANVPVLFANGGLGVLARPGQMSVQLNSMTDVPVSAAVNSSQTAVTLSRIRNLLSMGADRFYFDSCGGDYDSIQILSAIAAILPPNVPGYTEFTTDLTLLNFGAYCEWDAANNNIQWIGDPSKIALFRWLVPGSSFICKDGFHGPTDPFFTTNKITPFLQDYQVAENDALMTAWVASNLVKSAWPI